MADLIERINARLALMAAPPEWADKPVYVDAEPVRVLLREAAAALEAAREDGDRLDWFDANWFTAYRQCDPIDGLMAHCVVVDESQHPRRGCVADTFRAAIDQARGKGGAE